MDTQTNIQSYYNNLAETYDENRFGNSYGQYLHQQETKFLEKVIVQGNQILDLGCGTGRHMSLATHGLDISENMLQEARKKFPKKEIRTGSVFQSPFEHDFFDQVFSFHVLMHLTKKEIELTFQEAHRILKPRGQFIFDIPSFKRRNLFNYKTQGWHGAASLSMKEVQEMAGADWVIKKYQGALSLPIHRLPKGIRKVMLPIDTGLSKSFMREYASYLMVMLEKK